MTLLYVQTTTTTTVERQIHAVTDDEFVALLSAWRDTPRSAPVARVVEQVRTDVVNALTSTASGVLEDGIVAVDGLPLSDAERRRQVAERWTSSMGPVVEAQVSGRTVNAVLGAE